MTTRELSQIRELKKEVEHDERLITYLQSKFENVTGYEELRTSIVKKQEQLIKEYTEAECYITTIPDSLVRQILSIRYIEGLSWSQTALKIGGGNSPESIRKMVYRYMKGSD